jgi:putative oligomerization/nucleic acid binding protein
VRLRNGEEVLFQTEKLTAPELKVKLVPIISQLHRVNASAQAPAPTIAPPAAAPPPPVSAPVSVADEIKKLGELKESGLITEEEFATQKAKLLGL